MWSISFVILAVFCGQIQLLPTGDQLIVQTSTGALKGRYDDRGDVSYYSYLGIPYAEAPVGQLRFEPPIPKTSWQGTLDATDYRPQCAQGSNPVDGSEDCLFLNIFVPKTSSSSKLPVVVYIHGGAFLMGSGNLTEELPDRMLQKEVIVVSINYRLGILGFLSTGDQVVPGNNGLKDQITALKWIKANIEKFGGDSNQITVFGQSAGAASVSYLTLSSQTTNLYNRAIMDSGTAISLFALYKKNWEKTKQVATALGITSEDSRIVVDSLKNVDIETLQAEALNVFASTLLTESPLDGFPFTPCTEPNNANGVITTKTHNLMERGDFKKVPILIGHNTLEGSFEASGATSLFFLRYDLSPELLVPINMNVNNLVAKPQLGSKIKSEYFGFIPISLGSTQLMNFISDTEFVRPAQEYSRLWSKYAPTYYYVFSYEGNPSGAVNDVPGTAHSEELFYLFQRPNYVSTPTNDKVANKIVTLWTNFVKTGNPTPTVDQTLDNVVWPQVNGDELTYLNIGENLKVENNYRSSKMNFWRSLYQQYSSGPYDTY